VSPREWPQRIARDVLVSGLEHATRVDARQVHPGGREEIEESRIVEVGVDDRAVVMIGGHEDEGLPLTHEVVGIRGTDRDGLGPPGRRGQQERGCQDQHRSK
jgi:hypothetical protein